MRSLSPRTSALPIFRTRQLLALAVLILLAVTGRAAGAQGLAAAPALTFGTYVGGASDDWGQATAVDAQGNIIIAGYTYSATFPGTTGTRSDRQAFVTKLNPSGSAVLFSTTFGGSDGEDVTGVAVDAQGIIWVVG